MNNNKYKKVFVICPANAVTGGPDALHQMVFYLNQVGVDASIVYYCDRDNIKIAIPNAYENYVSRYLNFDEITDDSENAVILPDIYPHLIRKFKKAMVFMWWLGVTNDLAYSIHKKLFFLLKIPIKYLTNHRGFRNDPYNNIRAYLIKEKYNFKHEKINVIHLCASYHAFNYISKRTSQPVYRCIEPISKLFLEEYSNWNKESVRKNIVLYNPVKCGPYVESLIKKYKNISFVALRGYSQKQLIELYKVAKLYVDFGEFHGAERMPKEAALFGCAIITGGHGASGVYGDVPIPKEYILDESKVEPDVIITQILRCLEEYDLIQKDFNEYRNKILSLEESFILSLTSIFKD